MSSIYLGIFFMLIVATSFLVVANRNTLQFAKHKLILSTLLFCGMALGLYQFTGDKLALKNWLQHGKEHYALMQKFQDLGGLQGIIAKVEQRLANNPNDKQGWLILGKLYVANHDEVNAKRAFANAQ